MKRLFESVNCAIEGILQASKTQRHLRYHLYSAILVLFVSYILGVSRTDFLIISIMAVLVILAEMINTAIEYIVDMVSPEYSQKAMEIKDTSAGAVLITAFVAVVIGYIVLFPYLKDSFETGIKIARHSKEEITLLSLIVVLVSVIILKSHFGKGHPLRGGMPSGHSAVAFSIWSAVTFITKDFTISMFTFALAGLIAQSRVILKAHTTLEVVAGAMLGSALTTIIFLIFR